MKFKKIKSKKDNREICPAHPPTLILEKEMEAIDMTPIYYFRVLRSIRSGTLLRWDKAEKGIYKSN